MIRFQSACRTEGRTEIAFVASGTNLQLTFNCSMMPYGHERDCDFEKEPGKVSISNSFATFQLWEKNNKNNMSIENRINFKYSYIAKLTLCIRKYDTDADCA